MLRHFLLIALVLFLINNALYARSDDVKIVLVGIVLDADAKTSVANVTIELEDLVSQETQTIEPLADGQFSFNLQPDRKYNISTIDAEGNIVGTKVISTINKTDPEVLHTILEIGKTE